MKVIHKFFVIALLLSIIFSLSAVAAVQEDITFEQSDTGEVSTETISASPDDNQEINSVEDESSVNAAGDQNEKLKASEDEKLADTSFGTFSEIQTKINNAKNGDTIYLDGKTYVNDNKRQISFYDKNLTIIGGTEQNPKLIATLDALDLSSILYIYTNNYYSSKKYEYTLYLDSIIFCNSKNSAVNAKCNLYVDNCYFINNTATNYEDSALIFKDNNLDDYYYDYWYGDVEIYNLTVTNSYFINNRQTSSSSYGAAVNTGEINYYSYKYGTKRFKNCVFKDNSAYSGGAVYARYGTMLEECTFINNTASKFGGAIYSNGEANAVLNSQFINNSAVEGGAIYGDLVNISGSKFTSNRASFYGGALNINSYYTIRISSNEFTNNYAPYYNSDSMFLTSSSTYTKVISVDLTENIINSDKTEIYIDKGVSGLYVYILDNSTMQFCEGNIKIFALVTDDEGNKISAREFIFLVDGVEYTTKIVDSIAEIDYNATLSDTGKVVTQKITGSRDKIYNGALEILPFSVVFNFDDFTGAMGTAVKIPVYVTDAAGHPLERTIKATYNAQRKELVSYNGVAYVLISLPLQKTSFNLAVECEGETKVRKVNVMDPHDDIAIVIDMAETENGYTGRTVTLPIAVHDGNGNGLIGDLTVSYNGRTRVIPLIDGQADVLISLPIYETSFELSATFKGTNKICTINVIDPVSEIEASVDLPHNLTGNIGESLIIPVNVYDQNNNPLNGEITINYNDYELLRPLNATGQYDIAISLPLHETSFELTVNYKGIIKSCWIHVVDPNKPTHITINVNDSYAGEPGKSIIIPVSVVDQDGEPLTGSIFIEYNDHKKNATLTDGKANVQIGLPLTETSFEVAITYNGHTVTTMVNVVDNKPHVNSKITMPENITVEIGKTIIIPVHVTDDDGNLLKGDVVVYYNSTETTQTLVNGHVNVLISSQLQPTSFEVTVAYQDKQAHCMVNVVGPNPPVNAIIILPESESGHVKNTIVVPVMVFDENGNPLKGQIGIYYMGQDTTETLQNGHADVAIILPDNPTTFNLTIAFGETVKNCLITVKDASDIGETNDTVVTIEMEEDITGPVGKTLIIPIFVHDGKGNGLNGDVRASYYNYVEEKSLKDGKANIILTLPSAPTTFDLTIIYGDIFKTTRIIAVDTKNPMGDINEVSSNGTSVVIPFPKDATGDVTVNINGKDYNGTIINGQVILNINDLPDGSYDATVKYSGDGNYSPSEKTIIVIIKDSGVVDTKHPMANLTDVESNKDGTLIIPFPSDATGNVIVNINGKNYTGRIIDGKVVLDIKDLPAGNYTSIIYYSGDNNYANSTKTIVIVKDGDAVSPQNPMGDTTQTQTDDNNNIVIPFPSDATGKVVVKIGDNFYDGQVIDGKVVLDVKDLPVGNYDANVYYLGDGKYDSSARTMVFIIKETTTNNNNQNTPAKQPTAQAKKASKITAKKKTFKKAQKVKKYSITLKSGKTPLKKVQVTIKVGKKTYKAKTNNKGKATFKIKKLTKKGKHTAVIKFKGNKTYKATTKKVKITVK